MDFGFTPEEEAFRREVIDFVAKEVPLERRGLGNSLEDRMDTEDDWEFIKSMRLKLGAKGWFALGWPKEYGGLGLSHIYQLILSEEMTYRGAPGPDQGAVVRLGPLLIAHGTEDQKRRFLLPMARGETFWTQGFSEPEAGSDLASLRTRAVDKGDHFLVNGQKVWQTHGFHAEWCYFLARTDPDAPKHKGIGMLLVDLKTPGITVRPLMNIVDTYGFSEIFFDNVVVPKENLVGEKTQGWQLANATLNAERSGIHNIARCRRFHDELIDFVKHNKMDSPMKKGIVQHKLAQLAVEIEVGRLLSYQVAYMQSKDMEIRHQASVAKQFGAEVMQRMSETAVEILGLYGQLAKGSPWTPLQGKAEQWYLSTRARTIAGGTSEVQRTIIATRGLGLPRN